MGPGENPSARERGSASPAAGAPERLEEQAARWGLPAAADIDAAWLDPALIERLPLDWARRRGVLPVRREGRVCALTSTPERLADLEDLALLLGVDVAPVLAPPERIAAAIEQVYAQRGDTARDLLGALSAAPAPAPAATPSGAEDLLQSAEHAPVTQLVNLIVRDAIRARASDIHIEPHDRRVRVRFRVDGLLYDQDDPPPQLAAGLTSRLKVMARLDIAEKRLPQDGMARVRLGEREIDIRVSTVPIAGGERLVLRLLHQESAFLPLSELGLPPAAAAGLRELLAAPQGMLLVTGPTGSGKTTTLYAALRELDTRRRNVMTIEDPIEYQLPELSQIQVNPRIELTFARCLRHVLRQDPDVVLVGETRDLETAEIAVRASLTGHLVFTTLHTNDAVSAPLRLVDMGLEPYLLSASLLGVLAQRLVRRLCPACRERRVATPADVAPFGRAAAGWAGREHWVARGCSQCLEGYRGRLGVFELLRISVPLAEAVRGRATLAELRRLAAAAGMATLLDDGLRKAADGLTSFAELERVIGGPETE